MYRGMRELNWLKHVSTMNGLRLLIPLIPLIIAALSMPAVAAPPMLTIANAGEPETLDPHRYNLRLEETLLNDLFMGLTTFNASGDIVPGCARAWETSEDGLTWTFKLRENLKWSDGQALTAQDFVFSFRRLQDPKTAASLAYFMNMVKNATAVNTGKLPPAKLGISAPDPHTLVLQLDKPYPYLLERLLYPTAFPVPAHMIEKHGDAWIKPQNWVSNGAYTLVDWTPQAHIELRANPHFFAPAAITQARYLPIANEQSAFNRYRNGEVHAIPSFPVGSLAKMREQASPELRLSPLLSMFYLVFNTQSAPFDNVDVRQALSMAIDQSVLTDKVLRNGASPETTFTPATISNYAGFALPHSSRPLNERLASAQTLLERAGFGPANPLTVSMRHLNNLENKKVMLAIGAMWQRIGVQATLQQADVRSHFADLRQADFEIAWAGWVGENNAEHYLSLLRSDIGNVNYGRFANATFDAVMLRAQDQANLMNRNALLASAEEIVTHYYAVVPLYSSTVRRLVHPDLKGWRENPRDMHQLRYLTWRIPQLDP